MRFEYEHLSKHPRERVWQALADPELLARILPGVERFEAAGENRYDVVVQLGVPALKGRFSGAIQVRESEFPARYALHGEGEGAPGWVRGSAQVGLDARDGGTCVRSRIDAQVGGRIAGVGQRMLEGVARTLARELFEALDRELAGREPAGSRMLFLLRVVLDWLRGRFRGRRRSKPGSGSARTEDIAR